MNITMSLEESRAWRPSLPGWSDDILPWYRAFAEEARDGSVCVEIGVAYGRSLLFLASEFIRLGKKAHLWGFDPYPTDTKPSPWYAIAMRALIANATDEELQMISLARTHPDTTSGFGGADLIFIDGAHDFDGVTRDINWSVRQNAWIVAGHDYADYGPGVKQAVDTHASLRNCNHWHSVWWR